MKVAVLLLALVGYAYSQSNSDCNAFTFPNQIPPDHGSFGTCGNTIAHATTCSYSCDSDPINHWTLVGPAYSCNDGTISGGPQWCRFDNYVSPAQNCTVTSWGQRTDTDCNTMCGGGSEAWTRRIISYGEPGGEPCPTLAMNVPCNTQWCSDNIISEGYYHWGPFCADSTESRTVGYYVHTSENIDLYVFDQPDFDRYTWDSALSTAQNAYYSPVNAYLTTNFEHDTFTVPPNQCYHLVLDNTAVGPTQGNNGVYDNIYFEFAMYGVTADDGFSDFSYQKGLYQPAAAVRSSSVSFFGVFLTAIILLILKLE